MEVVVIIIMMLVCLSLLLKLTCLPSWGILVVCIILAFFVGLSWEEAAGQSKTRISDWLQNPDLMLDIAVLLTVDILIQISFCILNAGSIAGESLSKMQKFLRAATLWFPGILIFPTIFALLVEVIFTFTGVDFITLAWSLAALILIVGVAAPLFIRWLIPETDLRLELIFMINALIALLGVVATVNGRTAVAGTNSVRWQALLAVIIILLSGAALGLIIFNHKLKNQLSRNK